MSQVTRLPTMEKRFLDYFAADQVPARMTASTEFIDADCLLMIDGIAYKPS